jgi:hypothetical protein
MLRDRVSSSSNSGTTTMTIGEDVDVVDDVR